MSETQTQLPPLIIRAGEPLPDLTTVEWKSVEEIQIFGPLTQKEVNHAREAQHLSGLPIRHMDEDAQKAIDPPDYAR